MSVPSIAVKAGLTASKGEAARLIKQQSLYVNGQSVSDSGRAITDADVMRGEWIILRSGRKHYRLVRVRDDHGNGGPYH